LLQYSVGAAPNPRLGDKFTFEGDWNNGVLRFVDFNATNRYFEFRISGGNANPTIDPIPTIVTVHGLFAPSTGSSAGGVYKFSNTESLYSGTGKQAVVFNPVSKVATYTTNSAVFPISQVGDAMFTFNDKRYIAYLFAKNTFFGWALRIRPLDYPSLAESLEKISVKSLDINMSGVLADDVSSVTNGNGTGKIYVHRTSNGVTYIAAVVSNQGIGLFKIE